MNGASGQICYVRGGLVHFLSNRPDIGRSAVSGSGVGLPVAVKNTESFNLRQYEPLRIVHKVAGRLEAELLSQLDRLFFARRYEHFDAG